MLVIGTVGLAEVLEETSFLPVEHPAIKFTMHEFCYVWVWMNREDYMDIIR